MPAVLAALCAFFAWATYTSEAPTGREGGLQAADALLRRTPGPGRVLLVAGEDPEGREFAAAVRERLRGRVALVEGRGSPAEVRVLAERLASEESSPLQVVAAPGPARWALWQNLRARVEVVSPPAAGRSAFLSPTNLRNVADQIAVIAIIAVGMTMVIITGGIDLSVGSLVALSAVATAWLIRAWGGVQASPWAVAGACVVAIGASGLMGLVSGGCVTLFRIPPFIATLAMMQVASGLAFILAAGQTIYDVPPWFTSLGRGELPGSIPNTVALMLAIYALAHVLMARTAIGRRIYAVGGNPEAARLSGVNNARTLLFVYVVSGAMAGLGGVLTASQLKAGSPTYGLMYELYVIAAVVVGGTSLAGGEGKILGTLVGAFIIAVIRNGMNLMNIEPYTQKVVLGLVILGAVLADRLRRGRR